jgi:cell division inhibitor SepF
VLLNLSALPPDQKQRAADFMAGGAFALDGQQERLGEQVFLFAPHFVQLHHD